MPELRADLVPDAHRPWGRWATIAAVCLALGGLAAWWWDQRTPDVEHLTLSEEELEPPPAPPGVVLPQDRPLTLADFGIDPNAPVTPEEIAAAGTPDARAALSPPTALPAAAGNSSTVDIPTAAVPSMSTPPADAAGAVPLPDITTPTGEVTVLVGPREAMARASLGEVRGVVVRGGRASFLNVPLGEQQLTVEAPGYERHESRLPVAVGSQRHTVVLLPSKVEFTLQAQPGSEVTAVDELGHEIPLGMVPATGELQESERLRAGSYQFRVRHPRYEPWLGRYDLSSSQPRRVKAGQVLLTGLLSVESTPPGASVWIAGTERGVTPLIARGLPAGESVTVELRGEDFQNQRREIQVVAAKVTVVDFGVLAPRTGAVRLRLAAGLDALRGGEVEFRLDGRPVHPTTPAADVLATAWDFTGVSAGSHVIEVRPARLNPWADRVQVKSDEVTEVEVVLSGPASTALAEPAALAPQAGEPWTVPDLELGLVWVPPSAAAAIAEPPRERFAGLLTRPRVRIARGFWLGRYELTQREWHALMETNPSARQDRLDLPVENITWHEAMTFCRRLTERERAARRLPGGFEFTLPTEAQWEHACRAGGLSLSTDLSERAWHRDNSGERTQPVGQLRANAWGLYDMLGNVWEWTRDVPGTDTDGASLGSSSSGFRVNRGGGFGNAPATLTIDTRYPNSPRYRAPSLGVRIALVDTAR